MEQAGCLVALGFGYLRRLPAISLLRLPLPASASRAYKQQRCAVLLAYSDYLRQSWRKQARMGEPFMALGAAHWGPKLHKAQVQSALTCASLAAVATATEAEGLSVRGALILRCPCLWWCVPRVQLCAHLPSLVIPDALVPQKTFQAATAYAKIAASEQLDGRAPVAQEAEGAYSA
eukprot:GHVT01020914.1.p1 GENE.GHVT01020914.1~~GHVT01020914.1.p1  ORF type:complete len:176 (+),score=20.09 GHVT01020914.1:218-745(+)